MPDNDWCVIKRSDLGPQNGRITVGFIVLDGSTLPGHAPEKLRSQVLIQRMVMDAETFEGYVAAGDDMLYRAMDVEMRGAMSVLREGFRDPSTIIDVTAEAEDRQESA